MKKYKVTLNFEYVTKHDIQIILIASTKKELVYLMNKSMSMFPDYTWENYEENDIQGNIIDDLATLEIITT